MFYAYTQYTPTSETIACPTRTNGPASLILAHTKVRCTDAGWLLASPTTGGWCLLDDQEYELYQQVLYEAYIPEVSSTDRIHATQRKTLLHHLSRCGLIRAPTNREDLSATPTHPPRPFSLTLILSERCNLACKYCYLGISTNQKGRQLAPRLARKAIKDAFQQISDSILIDFGEIAVAYDLFQELVLYTEKLSNQYPNKKLLLAIQTNGTTLRPKVLDFLEAHQIIVGVSLDGPKHMNDRVRVSLAGLGSHERIEAGLREIIRRGMQHIVLCTVSAANIGHAPEILDHFLELGVLHFSFKPVIRRGNAKAEWESLGVSIQQFCNFLDDMVDYAISSHNWNALDDRFVKFIFRILRDPRGWSDRCPMAECGCGTQMLVLNPRGVFYPCPRFSSTAEDSFHLGRNLPQAVDIAAKVLSNTSDCLPSQCRKCVWWAFCKGGCQLACRSSGFAKQSCLDPACEVYQHTYKLIITRILPELGQTNNYANQKLGQVEVVNERIFH